MLMVSLPSIAGLDDDELDTLIREALDKKVQDLMQGRLPQCNALDDEEIASCVDYSLNRLSPQQRAEYEALKKARISEHLKTCEYHNALFCLLVKSKASERRECLN